MRLKSVYISQYKNLKEFTLLTVPANGQIRQQVINHNTGGNYGNRSLLTIELLFHGVAGLDAYFTIDTERTDGFIKFIGDSQKGHIR